ncbi:MAG: TIGR03663 family protein [Candidatus Buchananbacteria bacterium]|nr:TIGR03663 family protein [Candidatus Buchananbacteria bacterium]
MDNKMSNKIFWILFFAIFIMGAFFRFYELDLKPLHHDEGEEQYFFIEPLLDDKVLIWDYDNKGLIRHFISYPFVRFFGINAFSLRFTSALAGTITILLLLFLMKYIGKQGVLLSSALLSFSPFFIYYSRQYTPYPFDILFLLILLILILFYLDSRKRIYLILISIDLAIIFNSNVEAFLLFALVFLIFIYLLFLFKKDIYLKILTIIRDISFSYKLVLLFIFLFTFIFFQTSLFRNFNNLLNFPYSFFNLASKTVNTGHNKGFLYYFRIIYPYEIGLLFFWLIGIFKFKRNLFSKFLVFWSCAFLFIFSLIPYKTNWTIIYILFPLVLLAGNTFQYLIENWKTKRLLIITFTLLILVTSLYFSIEQNFIHINDFTKNKIGYVETSTDIFRLIDDINNYVDLNKDSKVLISAESSWPIPAYLKNLKLSYQTDLIGLNISDYPGYEIFMVNKDQLVGEYPEFEKREYELRKNYNLIVLYKN